MHKRIFCLFIICQLLFSSIALATEVTPRADLYFASATPALNSDQSVTFTATAYQIFSKISVIAVWVEQKIDGEWEYECYLSNPSYVSTNTFTYSTTVDYSSEIGTGTFRVWATFNADGYEITRCSNERTFN